MKLSLIATIASMCFATGVVIADEEVDVDDSKPIELTATQMDQVTAGSNILPNGKIIFGGFALPNVDDPYGEDFMTHPGLFSNPMFGPWSAHFNSPVIEEGL